MARAIWSGVLSFGLVAVPVELYSATEAHRPAFHQFEEGTGDRIRYQRVNERTGDEVEYADIVKGTDTGGGNYVLLDQDELDSVAPGRSRSLDVQVPASRRAAGRDQRVRLDRSPEGKRRCRKEDVAREGGQRG